jgi:hypothetical protein
MMRILLTLAIIHLVAVGGEARIVEGNYTSQRGVEIRGFHGGQANEAVGAIMAPRSDQGAVATQICGFLGGQISSSFI